MRVDAVGEVTDLEQNQRQQKDGTEARTKGKAMMAETEEQDTQSTATSVTSETLDTSTSTHVAPTSATSASSPASPATSRTAQEPHVATKVSFSQIQIREYPIIVGDNPSIMTGVPITIDWEFVQELEFALEEYEASRPQHRTMVELRIPGKHRDAILKRQGFSLADRNRGKKAANITKSRRKRTSDTEQLSSAVEAMEKMKRATLNATLYRRRKQKERTFLSPYKEEQKQSVE